MFIEHQFLDDYFLNTVSATSLLLPFGSLNLVMKLNVLVAGSNVAMRILKEPGTISAFIVSLGASNTVFVVVSIDT